MSLTLAQIKTRVEQALDLEEEFFITDDELINLINESIDEAEREIHTLYEDYFLDCQPLSLVTGQSLYRLPSNIYANKIRKMTYDAADRKYVITRLKKKEDILCSNTNDDYRYYILNIGDRSNVGSVINAYSGSSKIVTFNAEHQLSTGDSLSFYSSTGSALGSASVSSITTNKVIVIDTNVSTIGSGSTCNKIGGNYIKIIPTSQETSVENVKIWYIRNAKVLVNTTDVCDIPEFESFVLTSTKYKCLLKDIGNPMIMQVKNDLDRERESLIATLSKMIPDDDDFLLADVSFYEDFDTNYLR